MGATRSSTITHHLLYMRLSQSTLRLLVKVVDIAIALINTVWKMCTSAVTKHLSCSLMQVNSWQLPRYAWLDAHVSRISAVTHKRQRFTTPQGLHTNGPVQTKHIIHQDSAVWYSRSLYYYGDVDCKYLQLCGGSVYKTQSPPTAALVRGPNSTSLR